jgi:DNA polymerase-3 subunit delta
VAVWDFRQLQQNLDAKQFPNLALLYGEEAFLISEGLKLIKQKLTQEESSDFNYDQFFSGVDSVTKVRDTVELLPMMTPLRLVIFRDVEKLKEKDWEQLYPIIDQPVDSTCLILVATQVDKRKKFFKSCSKNGQIIELRKPYDNQVSAWIDYIAYKYQLKISKSAIAILHQMVGNQLMDLNSEIQKIKQYVGQREIVNDEDVLKVVSRLKVDSIFDLTEAIGNKDKITALTVLANLLDQGQNEMATMALILRHIRILGSLKSGIEQGLRGAKLCEKVGVPSFFLQKYMYQSQKWSSGQLNQTLSVLHETDKALKSSPVSSHIWLENFILKTCQ